MLYWIKWQFDNNERFTHGFDDDLSCSCWWSVALSTNVIYCVGWHAFAQQTPAMQCSHYFYDGIFPLMRLRWWWWTWTTNAQNWNSCICGNWEVRSYFWIAMKYPLHRIEHEARNVLETIIAKQFKENSKRSRYWILTNVFRIEWIFVVSFYGVCAGMLHTAFCLRVEQEKR